MPPDISQEDFEHVDDVQISCMPRSQLPTVLSSYEKTIGRSSVGVRYRGQDSCFACDDIAEYLLSWH